MSKVILGISSYYHDSAAALLVDGQIIAAAQEERFTRIKHDPSFPINATTYVLKEAGIRMEELASIAYYEKPLLKLERLLETYHAFAPRGLSSFLKSMPVWMKEKIFIRRMIHHELSKLGKAKIPIYFSEHHLSHAASAFYPSPFDKAAILTIDGVGEWANTTISSGNGNKIRVVREQHFPHSLGLLYSAFTYYLGFKVNGGEYKLMGLAAYGDPSSSQTQEYLQKINSEILDIREDGSILLNMDYFRFATNLRMTHDPLWKKLFDLDRRESFQKIEQKHANLALAIQNLTEEIVRKLASAALKLTKSDKLVMAGGVALNCVANGKLLDLPALDKLWIQPAAGDAGGALGAAYAIWHILLGKERKANFPDSMQGAYLGPDFHKKEIITSARKHNISYEEVSDERELLERAVDSLIDGKVVGWFQARMEFGPRALGNRSILGDPRNPAMQQKINLSIKFREGFRPFAPSVLEEDAVNFFDINTSSPYMLLVRELKQQRQISTSNGANKDLMTRLRQIRSDIPAVTHVDYSARIQTIDRDSNPRYRKLLERFKEKTGYGMLINTSFNIKDEPIVCTPEDAIRCFLKTKIDILIIGDFIIQK